MDGEIIEKRLINSVLSEIEHKKSIHNFGATISNTHTLPPANVGLEFEFLQTSAVSTVALTIRAGGGDNITIPGGISANGGAISATTSAAAMSYVKLKCFTKGHWHAKYQNGDWAPVA